MPSYKAETQLGPTSFYKEARTDVLHFATFSYNHSIQQVQSLFLPVTLHGESVHWPTSFCYIFLQSLNSASAIFIFTSDVAWGVRPLTYFILLHFLTITQFSKCNLYFYQWRWFLNHFLRWFLLVPPKDGFTQFLISIMFKILLSIGFTL